jgi:ABC-type bacteriocin/lantibiotic exporter with double-glycine peptidase domain
MMDNSSIKILNETPYIFIKQLGINDCGYSCLSMVLLHYGLCAYFNSPEYQKWITASGISILTLTEVASDFDLDCKTVECTLEELSEMQSFPCIILTSMQHYQVVFEILSDRVIIGEPLCGILEISRQEFKKRWYGPLKTEGIVTMIKKRQLVADD